MRRLTRGRSQGSTLLFKTEAEERGMLFTTQSQLEAERPSASPYFLTSIGWNASDLSYSLLTFHQGRGSSDRRELKLTEPRLLVGTITIAKTVPPITAFTWKTPIGSPSWVGDNCHFRVFFQLFWEFALGIRSLSIHENPLWLLFLMCAPYGQNQKGKEKWTITWIFKTESCWKTHSGNILYQH
jgi:hypothetical protein